MGSYTLFIVFLGGVIVIFIYTSSVTPKELFEGEVELQFLFKLALLLVSFILTLIFIYQNLSFTSEVFKFENAFYMFFCYRGKLFYLYLAVYLLYSLVCVVGLVKYNK